MKTRNCLRMRTKVSTLVICIVSVAKAFYTADEERTFLVGEELQFRTGTTEGEPTFIWRDIEGDATEFYEFVARGTNEPTRAFFETCMYRAMYERKYKQSSDKASPADLQEFVWKCVSFPGFFYPQ